MSIKLKELLDIYNNWQIDLLVHDKKTKVKLYDGDLQQFADWRGCGEVIGKIPEYSRILELPVKGFVCDNNPDYTGKMIVTVEDNL